MIDFARGFAYRACRQGRRSPGGPFSSILRYER
jgi:hypothetical protein